MIEILTAACGGFLASWICRARQLPMGPPRGSYGRPRHPCSDNGGPTTPKPPIKPQPSGGRMIREDQWNPDWEHLNSPNPPPL